MADLLLAMRGGRRVGTRWVQRFVVRRPELETRVNCAYDYERAFYEDRKVFGNWFRLVENMKAKYGIQDCDFYNLDETGFMVDMIRPSMVVTRSDRIGKPKSVQPGNSDFLREWGWVCDAAVSCGPRASPPRQLVHARCSPQRLGD